MNEMQSILEDMVERLFGDKTDAGLREAVEGGSWPADLWQSVEDQGLTKPLIPETQGGLGASWRESYAIVRGAGRHGLPLPLPETIAAGWLLARVGLSVEGPATLAFAQKGDALSVVSSQDKMRVSGQLRRVPWARGARFLVASVPDASGRAIALIPLAGASISHGANLAGEWRDDVSFKNQEATVAVLPDGGWKNPIATLGALLRAAQSAGALNRALELAVNYVNERKQFGRPIGKYQAIQQSLAVLATEAAAADVAAQAAFIAADAGDPELAAAVAKVRAAEAAGLGIGVAHQVHGAIGFTREYALQYFTRRLMAWRGECGGERSWAEVLGRKLLVAGPDDFWAEITAL